MKINIIKPHAHYQLGEHDVTPERGKYLIRMGWAEDPAAEKGAEENTPSEIPELDEQPEKKELPAKKEKVEKGPEKEKKVIKKP